MTSPTQETLSLFPEPLPAMPPSLEGYERGDLVWIWEGERRTKGRVLAALRSIHCLTIRTDDHRVLQVNPKDKSTAICKRSSDT